MVKLLRFIGLADAIMIIEDGTQAMHSDLYLHAAIKSWCIPKIVGKGIMIRVDIKPACGEVIIFQDADLENDPYVYLNSLQLIN